MMKLKVFILPLILLACGSSSDTENREEFLKTEYNEVEFDEKHLLKINSWLKNRMKEVNPYHYDSRWNTNITNEGKIENLGSFFILNSHPETYVKYEINNSYSYWEGGYDEKWFFNKNKDLIGYASTGSDAGNFSEYLVEFEINSRNKGQIEILREFEIHSDPGVTTYTFKIINNDSIKSLVIKGNGDFKITEFFSFIDVIGNIEEIYDVVENNIAKSDVQKSENHILNNLEDQLRVMDSICFTELENSGDNVIYSTNINGWVEDEDEEEGGYYNHWIQESTSLTMHKDMYESELNSGSYDTSISNPLLRSFIWEGIRDFDSFLYLFENEEYRVWVDIKNGEFRSAWWKPNQLLTEEPKVFTTNGIRKFQGSGGNHTFTFTENNDEYIIDMNVLGKTADDAFYMDKAAQIISPFSKEIIGQLKKNKPIDSKWLLIISGYDNCKSAKEAKKEVPFETFLLHSDNYNNLNPGWYIICLAFDNKTASEKASKFLNSQGFKSYIKFSGKYL